MFADRLALPETYREASFPGVQAGHHVQPHPAGGLGGRGDRREFFESLLLRLRVSRWRKFCAGAAAPAPAHPAAESAWVLEAWAELEAKPWGAVDVAALQQVLRVGDWGLGFLGLGLGKGVRYTSVAKVFCCHVPLLRLKRRKWPGRSLHVPGRPFRVWGLGAAIRPHSKPRTIEPPLTLASATEARCLPFFAAVRRYW